MSALRTGGGAGALAAVFVAGTAFAGFDIAPIDTSADRNATTINPGMTRIGTLRPRSVEEVGPSNWALDGSPLDRVGFSDFDKYCLYLPALGVDRLRVLTGWARSEKTQGVIDVAWLDHIVDWCLAHKIRPILELSYGHPIYPGAGGAGLRDGIPNKPEGLAAWDRWVDFLGGHFKGRVNEWAMWNEPDINPDENKSADIAAFNVRSAKILRRHMPNCILHGLSLAHNDPKYLRSCLEAMGGDVKLFNTFVYHGYTKCPETSYEKVVEQQKVVAELAPHARLRQGENGCASEWLDRMALRGLSWTEVSQAKWDMRRMLGDLGHDVESGLFCIVDFNYQPPTFPVFFCNRKGYLRTNPSNDVIRVKRAYYAVQNVVGVFDSSLSRVKTPGFTTTDRGVTSYEYRTKEGRPLFVFWSHGMTKFRKSPKSFDPASKIEVDILGDPPGDSFETRGCVFEWTGKPLVDPVWVDLMTGWVYELPKKLQIVHSCGITFAEIPLYDSPCVLTERASLSLME